MSELDMLQYLNVDCGQVWVDTWFVMDWMNKMMDGWIQFACLYAVIRISVEIFVFFLSQGQEVR